MSQQGNQAIMVGIGVLLVFGLASGLSADLLFKGKDPIKIGLGTQDGTTIKWTDCSGKKPETFKAPPYALDQADNCTVGPPTFGLQCERDSCTVVDEQKLNRYLPGVHNGESVGLRIEEHSVELRYRSAAGQVTLRLER